MEFAPNAIVVPVEFSNYAMENVERRERTSRKVCLRVEFSQSGNLARGGGGKSISMLLSVLITPVAESVADYQDTARY